MPQENSIEEMSRLIGENDKLRSFYVADLFDIYKKHLSWLLAMPRVKPFYSVKCNGLPEVLATLASLGLGFNCSSRQEVEQALAAGAKPADLLVGNPSKTRLFIKQAKGAQVDLLAFDSETELRKIAKLHPGARLVLRIQAALERDQEEAVPADFNITVGAPLNDCYHLLKLAKQLEMEVAGVAFHLGSERAQPGAFYQSIAASRAVYDLARELGHQISLLDIGGGFPGGSSADHPAQTSLAELAASINRALEAFFPVGCPVEVIAEPGRYYVTSALTLLTKVIGKRMVFDASLGRSCCVYRLADGVFGAFNDLLLADEGGPSSASSSTSSASSSPSPQLLDEASRQERQMYTSSMWGPSDDSLDCIKRDFVFPELQLGEWVVFKNKGAYGGCLASSAAGSQEGAKVLFGSVE